MYKIINLYSNSLPAAPRGPVCQDVSGRNVRSARKLLDVHLFEEAASMSTCTCRLTAWAGGAAGGEASGHSPSAAGGAERS